MMIHTLEDLSKLLTLLNHKNVLSYEGNGLRLHLAPSGPPVAGEEARDGEEFDE